PPVRRQPLGEPRGGGCRDDLHLASERQARRAACQRTPSSDIGHRTVSEAALVIALANAQADRRPTHARVAMSHDGLADAASASRLLGPFLGRRIGAKELAAVGALQTAVVAIVDALIEGSPPRLELLNGLAAKEPTIARLERQRDGTLHATLQPKHASAAATLVVAAIRELSELD